MRNPSHTFRLLAVVLAAGVISGQAMAQSTATADTFAAVLKPLTLVKASDLNFGVLLASAGNVAISPVDGTRTGDTGTLSTVNTAQPSRASFNVSGLNAATYSISAPAASVTLANTLTATDTLLVSLTGVHALSSGTTGTPGAASTGTLSANGTDTLGVGGSLTLTALTPVGNYTNTAGISLTVNYN